MMSSFDKIELQIDDGIATLTMNRPKKRNAFDVPMLREMLEATEEIDRNDSIRVAILTGAGRSFSAGADLLSATANSRNSSKPFTLLM